MLAERSDFVTNAGAACSAANFATRATTAGSRSTRRWPSPSVLTSVAPGPAVDELGRHPGRRICVRAVMDRLQRHDTVGRQRPTDQHLPREERAWQAGCVMSG